MRRRPRAPPRLARSSLWARWDPSTRQSKTEPVILAQQDENVGIDRPPLSMPNAGSTKLGSGHGSARRTQRLVAPSPAALQLQMHAFAWSVSSIWRWMVQYRLQRKEGAGEDKPTTINQTSNTQARSMQHSYPLYYYRQRTQTPVPTTILPLPICDSICIICTSTSISSAGKTRKHLYYVIQ